MPCLIGPGIYMYIPQTPQIYARFYPHPGREIHAAMTTSNTTLLSHMALLGTSLHIPYNR